MKIPAQKPVLYMSKETLGEFTIKHIVAFSFCAQARVAE